MKLVIGGYAQGKLCYVLSKTGLQPDAVWDKVPTKEELEEKNSINQDAPVIVNHLHLWVRGRILEGGCPEEEVMDFLSVCENCVIISDEIGNGIVPVEPFEREYRERAGRLLVRLADRAEEVERVLCGIGQRIK